MMKANFPQFRKLINDKSYYRIDSTSRITEIQRIGQRWTIYEVDAKILPERLMIQDILDENSSQYQAISEQEFQNFQAFCEASLVRFSS
jgi:hypothetical protein